MTSCFHCGKKIERGEKVKMEGLDIPYVNLFFHVPDCWREANTPNLLAYLTSKIGLVYNYSKKSEIKGKNNKI